MSLSLRRTTPFLSTLLALGVVACGSSGGFDSSSTTAVAEAAPAAGTDAATNPGIVADPGTGTGTGGTGAGTGTDTGAGTDTDTGTDSGASPGTGTTPDPGIAPIAEDTTPARNACFLAETKAAPATEAPRVVVADIDSGINAYHAFFRAGSSIYKNTAPSSVTPAVLAAFGIDDAHVLDLTRTGADNFARDFAADRAKFAAVKAGEFYWFKGTNIIAATTDPGTIPLLPDDEDDTHGTGTAASVLTANPEAIVLFVEGTGAAGETLAFTHPMVDMVTTSYGFPGSVPLDGHLTNSYQGVYCNGKLHFGAADNSPALSNGDGTSGPWWSIGVAGWEEGTSEGRQALSGNFVDFVADFTQALPYCMACENDATQSVGGTSFATPMSAGIASKILLETRRTYNDRGGIRLQAGEPTMAVGTGAQARLTNWQLRRALEVAAYVPKASEWNPTTGLLEQSTPVADNMPYVQVGWGLLSPIVAKGVVAEALGFLGVGPAGTRTKAAAFCTYQTQQLQTRRTFWDNDPRSESSATPADPYPFVACS